MNEIEYRPARDSDLEALIELWWDMQSSHNVYSKKYYKNIGLEKCKGLCHNYFKELLRKEDCLFYVANFKGTPIGMILAHFRTRPPVYEVCQDVEIEVAVVNQAYRGKGIFRKLLSIVEEKAMLAGVEMVEIIVDHDNSARQAYEKSGFFLRQDKMIKWL